MFEPHHYLTVVTQSDTGQYNMQHTFITAFEVQCDLSKPIFHHLFWDTAVRVCSRFFLSFFIYFTQIINRGFKNRVHFQKRKFFKIHSCPKDVSDRSWSSILYNLWGSFVKNFGWTYEKNTIHFLLISSQSCNLVWMPNLKFKS